MSCVFCDKIAAGDYLDEYDGIVHFAPLNPVTPGHLLVVPKIHVSDATEDPRVTGMTMFYAASLAKAPCNLITSAGREATQSVFHLHVHVVPRVKGDGLKLPWSGLVKE